MKAKQVIVMLLAMISFMCFGLSFNKIEAAAESVTYTFTSKSWEAKVGNTVANWTNVKEGAQLTTNQGVQISTGVSGASATSPVSYTNIEKIVVTYCTNEKSGVGTIKVKGNDGTNEVANSLKSFSVKAPSSGGTKLKTATFDYSSAKFSGYVNIKVTCSTNSIYINSIAITYTSDVAKPALSQEEFNNTNILKSLSFTYDERLSSNLTLNVSEMWAADSSIAHDTYVSSVSFGGITLSTPVAENGTFKDVFRHWISSGTKQLRLYKNDSITLSTSAPISSVEFVGTTTSATISTTGYSFSNKTKTISLDADATAVNSITFKVTGEAFVLTAINVVTKAQVDSSLPKYKNFTNVTLSLMSTFDPKNYSNELYYSNGIIVSTSESVATDYATVLPTNGTFDGNRYVVSGTTDDTAQADYVLNLAMSSLAKCNDTLYVYSYVSSMDSEANDFIYYTSVKTYSVTSIIDEYLALTGDQELSADMKELLTALKGAINAASTPAA